MSFYYKRRLALFYLFFLLMLVLKMKKYDQYILIFFTFTDSFSFIINIINSVRKYIRNKEYSNVESL